MSTEHQSGCICDVCAMRRDWAWIAVRDKVATNEVYIRLENYGRTVTNREAMSQFASGEAES